MALTLLIYSACMPFLIMTYLLRGIDLPTIFTVLALGFLYSAFVNALGIFAGSHIGKLAAPRPSGGGIADLSHPDCHLVYGNG